MNKCSRGYVDHTNCPTHVLRGCKCFPPEPENVGAAVMREMPIVSDHALAAAELLQQVVDRLHAGTSPEDLGADVQRFGRMMERKI